MLARVVVVLVVVVAVLGPRLGGATAAVRTPTRADTVAPARGRLRGAAAGAASATETGSPAPPAWPKTMRLHAAVLAKPSASGCAQPALRIPAWCVSRRMSMANGMWRQRPTVLSAWRSRSSERVIAQQRSPGAQRSKSVAVASSDSA